MASLVLQRGNGLGGTNSPPKLTQRQREVFQVLHDMIDAFGYPPSVRELARAAGLSRSAAYAHLRALERKGVIRRDRGKPRAIEAQAGPPMASSNSEATRVPLLGEIAAGTPILAGENVEEMFVLPRRLVGSGQLFMLRVRGDGALQADVRDGDYVVFRQLSRADHGELVVALVDGDAGDPTALLGKAVVVLRRLTAEDDAE